MRAELTGDTRGLEPSQINALERIYRRRVAATELVSYQLANFLADVSTELGRQVGVLINRRGVVEHVIVGDTSKLMLPDAADCAVPPGHLAAMTRTRRARQRAGGPPRRWRYRPG